MTDFGATVLAYGEQAVQLTMQGLAHHAGEGTTRRKLLTAMGHAFATVDLRAAQLLLEVDPRSTTEMIAEWEDLLGLPGPCLELGETLVDRRFALVSRMAAGGGQSRAYFVEVAREMGYEITIEEHFPFVAGRGRCGPGGTFANPESNTTTTYPPGYIYNGAGLENWAFVWTVHAPVLTPRFFRVGESTVGDPLVSADNSDLVCHLGELKPAHTHLNFAFDGPPPSGYGPWEELGPDPAATSFGAPTILVTSD